jgi:hypothetical protein
MPNARLGEGRVEKLQLFIKVLTRSRYGARSEKLDSDQLQLALEESLSRSARRRPSSIRKRPQAVRRPASARRRNADTAPCRRMCHESRSSPIVAHEILLKTWPTLQRWLEENCEFLVWRGELDGRRKEYDEAGKEGTRR